MGRGGCLGRGQGAARAGDEMMGTTHMAGNPILRRLSVRARAWGSPCSCGSEEEQPEALKRRAGSRVPREVVRGGASKYGDASHVCLDGGTSALRSGDVAPSHVDDAA